MQPMQIWLGNDHGGYDLKKEIAAFVEGHGREVGDAGCDSSEIVRYPYYAAKVANAVAVGVGGAASAFSRR